MFVDDQNVYQKWLRCLSADATEGIDKSAENLVLLCDDSTFKQKSDKTLTVRKHGAEADETPTVL